MGIVLFALPGSEHHAETLCAALGAERAAVHLRRFPDDESYVRLDSRVAGHDVVILGALDRPDSKLLSLYFLAHAAREQGARRVGLIAPYLPYMRQDKQFQTGEAVTSSAFATLLSGFLDWLVTVDPHLHRRKGLEEIYTIPCAVLHAAPVIAEWIRTAVPEPLLVGPDEESRQWVEAIAAAAGAPHIVLRKQRRGDRDVKVLTADFASWVGRTPVLADDIISTARTMIETVQQLRNTALRPPVCIGVHAIFAQNAYEDLERAGAGRIATCDTIAHPSNAICLAPALAAAVRSLFDGARLQQDPIAQHTSTV